MSRIKSQKIKFTGSQCAVTIRDVENVFAAPLHLVHVGQQLQQLLIFSCRLVVLQLLKLVLQLLFRGKFFLRFRRRSVARRRRDGRVEAVLVAERERIDGRSADGRSETRVFGPNAGRFGRTFRARRRLGLALHVDLVRVVADRWRSVVLFDDDVRDSVVQVESSQTDFGLDVSSRVSLVGNEFLVAGVELNTRLSRDCNRIFRIGFQNSVQSGK